MTGYVLDQDGKPPVPPAAPTLVVATKVGPKDVVLTAVNAKPDGTADTWQVAHDGPKAEPPEGRIRVTIRGKAYPMPFEAGGHGH